MALVVGLSRLKLRLHVCRRSSTCRVLCTLSRTCAVAARPSSDILSREYSGLSLPEFYLEGSRFTIAGKRQEFGGNPCFTR